MYQIYFNDDVDNNCIEMSEYTSMMQMILVSCAWKAVNVIRSFLIRGKSHEINNSISNNQK